MVSFVASKVLQVTTISFAFSVFIKDFDKRCYEQRKIFETDLRMTNVSVLVDNGTLFHRTNDLKVVLMYLSKGLTLYKLGNVLFFTQINEKQNKKFVA